MKKILITLMIAALGISINGCSGETGASNEQTSIKNENISMVVEEIFSTNFNDDFDSTDEIWSTTYIEVSEKNAFEQALVEEMSTMLSSEDRDIDNDVANGLLILDALGYQNETLKTTLTESADTRFESYINLRNGDGVNALVHLSNSLYLLDDTYYDILDNVLPKSEYAAFVEDYLDYAFTQAGPATINSILVAFCNINAYPAGELVPVDKTMEYYLSNGEPAIMQAGHGGYYDDMYDEFKNNSYSKEIEFGNADPSDGVTMYKEVSNRFICQGDFLLHYYVEGSERTFQVDDWSTTFNSYGDGSTTITLVYKDEQELPYPEAFKDAWPNGSKYAIVSDGTYIMLKEDRLYVPFVNGVAILDADFTPWIEQFVFGE